MVVRWLGLGFYSCIAMLRLLRLHGEHVHCHLSISLSIYTSLSLSPPPHPARAYTGCGWRTSLFRNPTGTIFLAPNPFCLSPTTFLLDHAGSRKGPSSRDHCRRGAAAVAAGETSLSFDDSLEHKRGVRRRGCRTPDRLDRRPLTPFDVGRNEGKLVNGRVLFIIRNPT